MVQGLPRESYIPARKAELIDAIRAEGGLSPADDAQFTQVCQLIAALFHHYANATLEKLKDLYLPLDPEAHPTQRSTSAGPVAAFNQAFADALTQANFIEIPSQEIHTRAATRLMADLHVKASNAGIRRIRFYERGCRTERLSFRRWWRRKAAEIDADILDDVLLVVEFKTAAEIAREDKKALEKRPGVRNGAVMIKHFRNVARGELLTLHPGAQPTMRPRDQIALAVPALVGGAPILLQLWPAMIVLFTVVSAYFGVRGAVDNDQLKKALASASLLLALGAFVMRQWVKYERQNLKYQKQLADVVYFRNVANNSGVLDALIGAGEDQDVKEAFLAYWALLRAGKPLAKPEIDSAVEELLRRRFGIDVDFEIGDALAKLERLALVERGDGDTLVAVPTIEALRRLDKVWDGLFDYAGAPSAS
jgi:hypothetical protein